MVALTYRDVIGRRLTNAEVDDNFRTLAEAVDEAISSGGATKVDKAGDTMTGALSVPALTVAGANAVIKTSVDDGNIVIVAHPTLIDGTARIELYGVSHSTQPKWAVYRGDRHVFTDALAASVRMQITSTAVGIGRPTGDGDVNSWPLNIGNGDSGGAGANRTFIRIGRAADGTAAIDAYRAGVGATDLVLSAYGSERMRLVAGGAQVQAVAVGGNTIADSIHGSTWYGIGKTSSDLFGTGATQVQVAGYAGVRIRAANAWLDIGTGNVGTNVQITAQRFAAGWDSGIAGSVSCSNWFRTSGTCGLYFSDYGCGIQAPTGPYGSVQTYASRGSWAGYSIDGAVQFMRSGTSVGIYWNSPGAWLMLSDTVGNTTFGGNVTAYSDRRLKRNIEPIRGALEKLLRLSGVSFERIDSGECGIGLIAQDVQAEFPEAVLESAPQPDSQDTVLSVAYGNLVGPIVEALREIDARLRVLEAA